VSNTEHHLPGKKVISYCISCCTTRDTSTLLQSIPCFRAHFVRTPAVPALAVYLPTILTRIHTKRAPTFALAVLRTALAAVSSSLLRGLQDRNFAAGLSITIRSFKSILFTRCMGLRNWRRWCTLILGVLGVI
jgi:energy-converting hydrogenase Eha subunit B